MRLLCVLAVVLAVSCGGDGSPAIATDPKVAAELYVSLVWGELTPSEQAAMCAASDAELRSVLAAGDRAGGASIDLDQAIAVLRSYC